MTGEAAFRPGETCWRTERAGRLKFLVDCGSYFTLLRQAMATARRSIHVLGWGFDPRIALVPGRDTGNQIGHELVRLADANPDLDVRLLVWRSALPISATQAFFPHRAKARFEHTRVNFQLDAEVPFGACHHQKAVIIDDALAFVGGADLMPGRWDTTAHLDNDPRRVELGEHPNRHEVMTMVDGPAAAALGELFRRRWRNALDDEPPAAAETAADIWPTDVAPDLVDTPVAIARTLPAWRGAPAVREIADLTLEAIAGAKSLIYLENQYFTWPMAVEALAARLAEPDGPEVVLICSHASPSYFDRITMDRARSNALWRLMASDVYGRFHSFAPHTAGGQPIVVHAKLMVIDDTLARISSANLNNRSHGFDTECELAVAGDSEIHRAALAAFRDGLAAHWIGGDGAALTAAHPGGFAEALKTADVDHRLRALWPQRLSAAGEFIADFHLGDPSDVSDSWRLGSRRERLITESRALRRRLAPAGSEG